LSPDYRGISVLRADDLASQALIAGSPALPLARAAALAVLSDGRWVVAEGNALYWISPEEFEVVGRVNLSNPVSQGGLVADPAGGRIVGADADSISVY